MVALARTQDRLSYAFDPDAYRMTLGEHLEELPAGSSGHCSGSGWRWGLRSFVGRATGSSFSLPAAHRGTAELDLNTQLQEQTPGSVFMLYLKVCMITAACASAPWSLYQLWRFVAAGLYARTQAPHALRPAQRHAARRRDGVRLLRGPAVDHASSSRSR